MDQRSVSSKYKSYYKTLKRKHRDHDFGLGDGYLDVTPKAQASKKKTNKLNIIKIKTFAYERNAIKRMKRQATEQEKILGNHFSDKGLVFGTYKELLQLNKKTSNPIKQ